MRPCHYVNWFCLTKDCDYSKESQESASLQDRVILESQRTGEGVHNMMGRLSTISESY